MYHQIRGERSLGHSTAEPQAGDANSARLRLVGVLPEESTDELTQDDSVKHPTSGGTVIGGYHLLQMLGRGGMGEVWLADQKHPIRRRVALKLIKAGMDTREVVERFESERQALALMDHPAIAKVFDAGSTSQGRPYFVMEYVDGIPITKYCDRHQLTIRQRLELFVAVCEGVQYAHQKAVIHRDLKPSNILVEKGDGKPRPRIIDFGVAKATSRALAGGSALTRLGKVVGTPGYMSPEQADPAGPGIDARTDVYSLGVVLYELLAGVRPIDLSKIPLGPIPQRIFEEELERPSARIRSPESHSAAVAAARNRGTDLLHLAGELNGDLDAIALKAIEYDRSRRYDSPAELAADIQRHLRREPVAARPSFVVYRIHQFVRRHRIGVAIAALIAVVMVSFGLMQSVELRRIRRERDRADRITAFMTGMFKVSNPGEARGNAVTAREILDKASKEIGTGLARDPELQAKMMQIMGRVYDDLGLYPQAQELLGQATATAQRVLGREHPDTLTSQYHLGWVLQQQGRLPEAGTLLRKTLDSRRRVLGATHPNTLRSMNGLAATLFQMGQRTEAENLQHEALDICRRVLGPEDQLTLDSLNNLANMIYYRGQLDEAERLHREAWGGRSRVLGSDHPDTLASMQNLSAILIDQRRIAEAEQLLRETLRTQTRVLGLKHRQTLSSMGYLASVLDQQGRFAEAEALHRQTWTGRQMVLGLDHPETLESAANLAATLDHEGRSQEAGKLLRETLATQRRVLGPSHPETAASTYRLAVIALHNGDRDKALTLLWDAIGHGLGPKEELGLGMDQDLKPLYGDRRFQSLVAQAKQLAARAQSRH